MIIPETPKMVVGLRRVALELPSEGGIILGGQRANGMCFSRYRCGLFRVNIGGENRFSNPRIAYEPFGPFSKIIGCQKPGNPKISELIVGKVKILISREFIKINNQEGNCLIFCPKFLILYEMPNNPYLEKSLEPKPSTINQFPIHKEEEQLNGKETLNARLPSFSAY